MSFICFANADGAVCVIPPGGGVSSCTGEVANPEAFLANFDESVKFLDVDNPPPFKFIEFLLPVVLAVVPDMVEHLHAGKATLFDNVDALLNDVLPCTIELYHDVKTISDSKSTMAGVQVIDLMHKHLPIIGNCARDSAHLTKFMKVETFDFLVTVIRKTWNHFYVTRIQPQIVKGQEPNPLPLSGLKPYLPYYVSLEDVPFSFFILTATMMKRTQVIRMIDIFLPVVPEVLSLFTQLRNDVIAKNKGACIRRITAINDIFQIANADVSAHCNQLIGQ